MSNGAPYHASAVRDQAEVHGLPRERPRGLESPTITLLEVEHAFDGSGDGSLRRDSEIDLRRRAADEPGLGVKESDLDVGASVFDFSGRLVSLAATCHAERGNQWAGLTNSIHWAPRRMHEPTAGQMQYRAGAVDTTHRR